MIEPKVNKVLLYFPTEIDKSVNKGIYDKFRSQIIGFQNNGYEVDYIFHFKDGIIINDQKYSIGNSILSKIFYNLKPFWGYYLYFFLSKINFSNYCIFFVRHKTTTPLLIFLLLKIKKATPKLKIVLEFPTFPIYGEFNKFYYKIYFAFEKQLSKLLKKFVCYSCNYTNFSEIYKIESIPIFNGFNYPLLKYNLPKKLDYTKNCYTFLAMASSIELCHGFDKIITNFGEFKTNNTHLNLKLYIVGIGPELENLISLVNKLKIKEQVVFTNMLNDEEIFKLLKEVDFCFSSMAIYRKNLKYESPLKSVYYCIAGKPFAISGIDSRFGMDFPFCFRVPNNPSNINFENIITFIEQLKQTTPNFSESMRNYAIENLSWESQIKKMLQQINVA